LLCVFPLVAQLASLRKRATVAEEAAQAAKVSLAAANKSVAAAEARAAAAEQDAAITAAAATAATKTMSDGHALSVLQSEYDLAMGRLELLQEAERDYKEEVADLQDEVAELEADLNAQRDMSAQLAAKLQLALGPS